MLFAAAAAQASVTVLLEEPYGDLGRWYPAGHTAVYLDHVCAATPLVLRPCGPGELGVVISRYDGIGDHDWIAIPLMPYLYAVSRAEDIPVAVDAGDVARLREEYRRAYLKDVVPDTPEGKAPEGNWYELIGSAFDRTLYGFELKSTPEQDAALISRMNDHRNREVYNGLYRNCADFVRTTVNGFYPHAVHRNFIADFGLTSPKGVARGLAHFGAKHPEAGLRVFSVAQISGSLPRSHANVELSEGILKEFGLPLAVLSPATTAAMFAAYVGHGRFAEPRSAPVMNLRADVTWRGALTPSSLAAGPQTPRTVDQSSLPATALAAVAMPANGHPQSKPTPAASPAVVHTASFIPVAATE